MKTKSIVALAIIIICFFTNKLSAATMVTNPGGSDYSWSNETVGTLFQLGPADLIVTAIGIYDSDSDGLSQSYTVGIYSSSGTLLTSDVVLGGTSARLEDGSRWADLSNTITLNAGEQYLVAAYRPNLNDPFPWFSAGQATIDSNVTLLDDRYHIGGPGLNFPTLSESRLAVVGANLQYSVVPEPSTAVLFVGVGAIPMFFSGASAKTSAKSIALKTKQQKIYETNKTNDGGGGSRAGTGNDGNGNLASRHVRQRAKHVHD